MEGIQITVDGHPAQITRLLPHHAGGPPEEGGEVRAPTLLALVTYDKPVDGIVTFGIEIPAKDYSREELVIIVEDKACRRLWQGRDEARRAKEREEKMNKLKALVAGVCRKLGIPE